MNNVFCIATILRISSVFNKFFGSIISSKQETFYTPFPRIQPPVTQFSRKINAAFQFYALSIPV